MKMLTALIWLSWSAICARVALASTLRLTLSESLVLLLACAPLGGVLCWVRWILRPDEKARARNREREHTSVSDAARRLPDVENYTGVVGQLF